MHLRTVLIADDSPEWRSAIAEILHPAYPVVRQVGRGDEVIAAASLIDPDLITLDVSMPGISGLNLLPRLRTLFPNTTIVIVTTNSDRLYVAEAYQRGADAYILKANAQRDLPPALQNARVPRQPAARA